MNEHTLPEDLSRWPDNPFELLGVTAGVSERELRRAYARLIRIYKPEQFPEHFRRVRDAYEHVRNYVQYRTAFETPGNSPEISAEAQQRSEHVPQTPSADQRRNHQRCAR